MANLSDIVIKEESVKCHGCGKIFESKSNLFFVIYGNITIGLEGGIIGNNFADDGNLCGATVFCRSDCLYKILRADGLGSSLRKM